MNAFERILEGIGAVEVVAVMGFLILIAYSRWSIGRRDKLRSTEGNARVSRPEERLVMFSGRIEGLSQDAEMLIQKRTSTGQDRKLRRTAIVR